MNTYKISVKARCPKDHGIDVYKFTLKSRSIIFCEDIKRFFDKNAGKRHVYQEDLTARCATALGCRVRSVGHHSGIRVVCVVP